MSTNVHNTMNHTEHQVTDSLGRTRSLTIISGVSGSLPVAIFRHQSVVISVGGISGIRLCKAEVVVAGSVVVQA